MSGPNGRGKELNNRDIRKQESFVLFINVIFLEDSI